MSVNPLELLRILTAGILPNDHIVSVNDVRKGPVTAANVVFQGAKFIFDYTFTMDNSTVQVHGESPMQNIGRPGGNDTIIINGQEVQGDDIVISSRIVTGGLAILIIFKFITDDGHRRIRIDALKRWI